MIADNQNKKNNLAELKRDLVDDLDQFLLDNDLDKKLVPDEKKKALAELDKLIKQDLSYSQILSTIKRDIKIKAEEKEQNKNDDDFSGKTGQGQDDNFKRSHHILNLKDLSKEDIHDKKNFYYKLKLALGNFGDKFNAFWHLPKLNLNMAFSKSLIFALILAIILLPIRAVVVFDQINKDKTDILGFGQNGLVDLKSGVISASENSYQEAQVDFENSLRNFSQAQDILNEYHQWILNTAGSLPLIGKPISLSRNMLSVATNISEAATILNQTIQDNGDPTDYIVLIQEKISQTLPYLEEANTDLNGISTSLLPENFREYFDGLKNYLPSAIENLKELNDIFSLSADLLGHKTEKRYIVLFQNNNEIRPTGGFIGSFALFDVYHGKIINLEVPGGGLYDLEAGQKVALKAPQALSLINSKFNIWDANWWYDFPTSAKKVMWFYQQAGATSLDGVIAINANVLAELLFVLGPVTLEEYGLTITSDNIFSVLQEEVELNYDKETNQPKAIIGDLVPVVLERLLANRDKQKEIVSVFAKTLASRDIQIYSQDQDIQDYLVNFGWAGQALDYNRDYLAVINTNIAGGKTDNNIHQIIDHQAQILANGEIINTIKITRSYQSDENSMFAGIYGGNASYLRVYTPLGSQFIEAVGFDKIPDNYFVENDNSQIDKDLSQEEIKMIDKNSSTEIFTSLNRTVFANWMTLAPGQTKTVLIKYKLPFKLDFGDPLVNSWPEKIFKRDINLDNYSLVVQAQSGLKNNLFNSSVMLPDNVKLVFNNALDDNSVNIANNLFTYTKELSHDQYFGFILADK